MRFICVFILSALAVWGAVFTTGQAARSVIGQPTFTQGDPGASQKLVGGISGVAYANHALIVADANRIGAAPVNNRVLIFQNLSSQLPRPTDETVQGARCPLCVGEASVVLGQPDFQKTDIGLSQTALRTPTAVATDGNVLAVADTDNNRVLIWKSIPAANNTPADVVIGQPNFTSNSTVAPPTAASMRGPQGVWIQAGKLYVADTQNHRVLIYNSIPASNGAAADVVLGQPNFTTFVQPDLTQASADALPDNVLNPVSVTSDGEHLFVTDLGHNRVLIWNSLPTQNQQPADLAIGQPDLKSAISNNSTVMCASNGTDTAGKPTYPPLCDNTLSFPRYALSDGTRLFIADGGNDRVLVYDHIPTTNGAKPDVILGQVNGLTDQTSNSSDRMSAPSSLAWDGTNLYVSDTYNRRILVFSMAEPKVPFGAVRNAASFQVYAVGAINFTGTINENDEVTITIAGKDYKYKILKTDTFDVVVNSLVNLINAGTGDPNVLATPNDVVQGILLTSRKPGVNGNGIAYTTATSSGAKIVATTGGASLVGGQDTAQLAPGALLTITGTGLSESTGVEPGTGKFLPTEIAGAQVYMDGARVPLLYVSPTQINAQIPIAMAGASSISVYVRTKHKDGTVTVTTPVAVTIVPENPGIFAEGGNDPRPGLVFHGTPFASATISVDGSVNAGDVATVKIRDRSYTYTVKSTDSLATIRDSLVTAIKADPEVTASAAGVFTRIRLQARTRGAAGQGIPYTAAVTGSAAKLLLTATSSALCCANAGRATTANPVVSGETITLYATSLGLPKDLTGYETGRRYDGPGTEPVEFVSSLAGGKTANVLEASPWPGSVGVWEVQLELNSDLPTDPLTQLTIAQFTYVSNIITFPVKKP